MVTKNDRPDDSARDRKSEKTEHTPQTQALSKLQDAVWDALRRDNKISSQQSDNSQRAEQNGEKGKAKDKHDSLKPFEQEGQGLKTSKHLPILNLVDSRMNHKEDSTHGSHALKAGSPDAKHNVNENHKANDKKHISTPHSRHEQATQHSQNSHDTNHVPGRSEHKPEDPKAHKTGSHHLNPEHHEKGGDDQQTIGGKQAHASEQVRGGNKNPQGDITKPAQGENKDPHGDTSKQPQGDARPKPLEAKPESADKPSTGDGHLKLNLTQAQKEEIGARIRRNESGTTSADGGKGLTEWNSGEAFPSLGIGHEIWQPKGSNSQFGDSFKSMVKYMEDHNVKNIPSWLNSETPSPWGSREQFKADYNSPKMTELRGFLASTIPQQTDYAVQRLENSLPKMLEASDPDKRQKVQENFDKVLNSGAAGTFALVDYVNFKGEGLTKGNEWGLRQVLENMKDSGNPVKDFSESARGVLTNRVNNAPAERQAQEQKWLAGWTNRVNDYQRPFTEKGSEQQKPEQEKLEQPKPEQPKSEQTASKVTELNHLDNCAADHKTPDAIVRIPANFDPSKPVNLVVYNHGWGSTAQSAFKDNQLDKQMASAPPNTVLIVPEWQKNAGARNSDQGKFSEPDKFKNMLQEVFDKTPGLQGKSINDVSGIDIVSHSAGYKPSETEINKNGLSDKVKSITLLDSNYDGTGFDKWLKSNVKDLSDGIKQFHNFFNGTANESKAQAQRVEKMLKEAGLPTSSVYKDYNNGNQVMDRQTINDHAIIFKYSNVSEKGLDAHLTMPHLYSTPPEHGAKGDNQQPEQPKPEQAKPEQPKPEQPKPEQPKPEQPKPEQPKPEQPKPEQPKPAQPTEFHLPESVTDKAQPAKGQGYYEPIKEAFSELLGRNLSEGETRAAISAARALRQSQGKPVNSLSTHDMLMPTTKEEAKKFLDNLGNNRFGVQLMSKSNIDKFRDEIGKKFDASSGQAKPEQPKPEQPKPEQPKPEQPKPEQPKPEQPKPEQPKPEQPKPEQPKPEQPKQEQNQPQPKPEQNSELPKPTNPQKPEQPIQAQLESDSDSPITMKPGDLGQNAAIINLAGGSPSDGVGTVNDRNTLVRPVVNPPEGLSKDIPVAVVPGVKPGTLGLLSMRDKNGEQHLVPFVAGLMSNGKGTQQDVVINNAAAEQLGLKQAQKGTSPASAGRIDVITLDKPAELPKSSDALKQAVGDRIKEVASKPEVLEKAEKALEGKEVKDSAFIPKADSEYGYIRTNRNSEQLDKIRAKFESEANKYHDLAEKVKPGSPDSAAVIQKTLREAKAEKDHLSTEQSHMQQLAVELKSGKTASDLSDNFINSMPVDIKRELNLARYNRDAYQKNIDVVNNPFYLFVDKTPYTQAAQQNMQAAQRQEKDALTAAAKYLQVDNDKKTLQDRIISDASSPQAPELLQHRFTMKAAAASVIAANPDMAPDKSASGALQGARIVINGGHDPFHGSGFTGFPAYDWSKTEQNPKGLSEYDLNKQTSAILGEIVEYSGGVPIYVHQDELYKKGDTAAQGMTGLARAMEAPKADIMVSNHGDDDTGIKAGTLTLVNSQSHQLGALVSQGKGSVGSEPLKGTREQPRGVQHYLHGNAFLNEILSTAPEDRQKMLNPQEIAKLQLGVAIGMQRFLHPETQGKLRAEMSNEKDRISWDQYWKNNPAKPKFDSYSLAYPRS